jgi:CPA2 family monovalent cation:H+ antiporter-2
MHDVKFLQDLAVVMVAAALATLLCRQFRQPVVLGYLLAGVIIGPHTPPASLITDQGTIQTLAELGVVFLMFSLGMEFNLRKLKQVGAAAFLATTLEILLMAWAGFVIGRLFGWPTMDCVFLGAMLSISSTTIIAKALGELGLTRAPFAHLVFGILVVEDLFAIVMIALLSGIAMTGSLNPGELLTTVGRLAVFLVVALVLGLLAVPPLLARVGRLRSNEILLVTVLGLCFGVSLLAVKLGYSVALGAFVIGAVIAEAREIGRIEDLTAPLRDMFSAVFFVAIGLMIDPRMLLTHWLPILVLTAVVILGKVLAVTFGAFTAGNEPRTALRVGMSLSQIGEFSFIIAALGQTLQVTGTHLYPIAVCVSALTTFSTPYLIRNSDKAIAWFDRTAPPRFVKYLSLYTQWSGQWQASRHQDMAARLARRWTWQMGLNLALVSAIFIAAGFVADWNPDWLKVVPGGHNEIHAAVWLVAMLLSLPLLVATYRKLGAMGMMLGEIAANHFAPASRPVGIQATIANTVPIAGAVAMGLLLLLLSAPFLPTWRIFVFLMVVILAVVVLLRRSLIRIYAKAQASIEETFAQPPPPRHPDAPLANLLQQAAIETVPIAAESAAAGKLIREIALRTCSGASIVALERAGQTIPNPGPDEELLAGDQVLLLGSRAQLDAALKLLRG